MKCRNGCGKDLTGRQLLYCSDKCRMQHKRTAESERDAPQPEQINPNTKVEQMKARIDSVRDSDGSMEDNVREMSEKLVAGLGSPVFEPSDK
ncbi:hypothetical protein LCGC14_1734240, partial [marine sediment metagenome]